MAIYYSGEIRKGAKVVRLPVILRCREHCAVTRTKHVLREHTGRIIMASERFAKLIGR